MIHQLMHHHIDRGQRLDQIHHQRFGIGLRVDGKQGTRRARCGLDVGGGGNVEGERGFGRLVELV
ncbi:hypothetical protein D3C75_836220 [compost metagenome]